MRDEFLDRCEVQCIHEESVIAVQKEMIKDEIVFELADFFKTLGDSTRIKMLYALMQRELCVCDLAAVIGASDSAVSHQLRVLRSQKLVKFRREGKILYYSLDDEHVRSLFAQGLEHVME
ncbi:ArsR-type transcription regulator, HTH motif [Syntrophomonas zehnderi OL-4]|uniref:ArsR-type transcription regulator, HTH motif n=1 Tax=Syntrophomonas zehnderi OL-4 TaxID=690567 RepID=A0A0E4G8X9_9FIRM|nr:metalloregulator ArsR/SmtB family transcription factor [Syntrophomonas zehnderi]CFX00713.1 ArsR-type transcription regulator, HTH motif [Syntrophomonas zehnderi OL-4]